MSDNSKKNSPWRKNLANNTRQKEIKGRLTSKFNYGIHSTPAESTGLLAAALSFTPSLFSEELIHITNFTVIPKEDINVEPLLDTIDLATLVNDPSVRYIMGSPGGTLPEARMMYEKKPYRIISISDGTHSLSEFKQVWTNNNRHLHVSNSHPTCYLTNPQQQHIKDTFDFSNEITQIEQNESLSKEKKQQKKAKVRLHLQNLLEEYSASRYYATGTDVISSVTNPKELKCIRECADDAISGTLQQNKSNETEHSANIGYTEEYLNSRISCFDVYCVKLFQLAKLQLGVEKDSDIQKVEQYEKISTAMGKIALKLKEYGISSKLHPHLLERFLNHFNRDGDLESFGKYMDIFNYLGTKGLFFIDEQEEEGKRYQSVDTNLSRNPLISATNPENTKRIKEENILVNTGRLYILQQRLTELFKVLDSSFNKGNESDELISEWLKNQTSKFYLPKITSKNQKAFNEHIERFKHSSYQYILTYVGGQLRFLTPLIQENKEIWPLRLFGKFRVFLELQYLKHLGDEFRSGEITPYPAENAAQKTLSMFWKPKTSDFCNTLKMRLNSFYANVSDSTLKYLGTLLQPPSTDFKKYFAQMLREDNGVGVLANIYDLACQSDKWGTLELDNKDSKDDSESEAELLELDEVTERNTRNKELQTHFEELVRDLQEELIHIQKIRSTLRFFYRTHGFTLHPKAVDYFIPPNGRYRVKINESLFSNAFFQHVRKNDGALFLQEEENKDIYRSYPVGIRSDVLSDEFTHYMRRRQILRYRKKHQGKTFEQFVIFTFNKGKSKNSKGISEKKKQIYQDIWDSITNVDANLKDTLRKITELKDGRYYPDRSGTRKRNRKFYGKENPEDRRKYELKKQANLERVQANLGRLQGKTMVSYPQTKDDIPVFVDPRKSKYYGYGKPSEVKTQYEKDRSQLYQMTLKDKKYLAATSWQLLCRNTAIICETVAKHTPLEKKEIRNKIGDNLRKNKPKVTVPSQKKIEEQLYTQLRNFSQFDSPQSPLKDPGFRLLAGNIKTKWDEVEKLECIRSILFSSPNQPDRFPEVREMLSCSYSVPLYFKKYLASLRQFRGLDLQYIRNLIVGWRRRMDPEMNSKLEIEDVPEHIQTLVTSIRELLKEKNYNSETRKNMDKVLHFLHRNRCVHFLWESDFDVTLFTKESYREGLTELKELVELESIPPDRTFFSGKKTEFGKKYIEKAVKREIDRVDKIIKDEEANKKRDQQKISRFKAFKKKIELIGELYTKFEILYRQCLPGNQFFGTIAKFYEYYCKDKKEYQHIGRMYTAVRAVLSSAYTIRYKNNKTVNMQFEKAFTAKNCITPAFQSTERKRNKYQPIKIVKPKDIIQIRIENTIDNDLIHSFEESTTKADDATFHKVTIAIREDRTIWLGIPIIPLRKVQSNGIIELEGEKLRKRFWFKLIFSEKIKQCIEKGAEIATIQIPAPKNPSKKLVVNVILKASSRDVFSHNTKFLQEIETEYDEWVNKKLKPLKSSHPKDIGSDNNTIGLFTIALGLVDNVIELHKKGQPLFHHEEVKKKLKAIKRHIKSVQKKRDTATDMDKIQLYKLEYQLLHNRIARIRTETKREAMRIFAFVVKFLEIKYIGVDDIRGLNNRGKKGKLANAITDLGKSQEYFAYFHELIEDIGTEYNDEITQTMYIMMQDPRTSSECPKCGERGKTKEFHPKGKYRKFICPKCDHKGDRDPIAAQISAKKTYETRKDYEKFKTAVVSAIDHGGLT